MSHAVVLVGPTTVRGPGTVDAELATVALDGIDDDLVLVGERVVPVDELWRDVLVAALGGRRDGILVICPSWWASARIARVAAAARACAADVAVRRRVDMLTAVATTVEVAPDLVVVHSDSQRHAVARVGAPAGVVGAVLACVDGLDAVTVDVPSGHEVFGAELARALRRRGIAVTVADDRAVVRAGLAQHADVVVTGGSFWRHAISPRAAVLAGAVVSVTVLAAAGFGVGGGPTATIETTDGTWLVEGRVAVEIPAEWTVERITSGPGSARVRVFSPSDAFSAIQVTQSRVPAGQTLDMTADTLRLALANEPDGVFVDFIALGRRAQRPVVTYREIRADHHVAWAVMLDRGVRIAIGCQGAPDGVGPEPLCDRAIRSAHAVA